MEAAREVAAAKEKAAEEVRAAQHQFQDVMKAIELLEKEGEDDATKISELENQVADLESNLQKVGNDNAALNATVEQLQHQLKSNEVEAARLHREIQGERDRHQEILKEKEAVVREAATLQGQTQALKEQNDELLSRLGDRKEKRG
jgi:chromosome segregation ATPase